MRRLLSPARLAILAVLVLFALALPLWVGRRPVPEVQAVGVKSGLFEVQVATNGKIEPLPEAELEVRARLDGRVLYLPDPGTRVEAGAEVLRIEQEPVAAELAAARSERVAALEALRTARDEAAVRRERYATDGRLHAEGALTRERHAESRAALSDAEARLKSLEQEVPLRVSGLDLRISDLEEKLAAAVVTAPFAGTVYRTESKRGALVRTGDPVLWFADLTRLRVRANVDQVDLGRVREGQSVVVSSNAFPGRTWSGRVTELVPHVFFRENRSISEGLARLDPPTDGLVPGMTVDVQIVVARAEDAIQIPAEAVVTKQNESSVYRVDGRRVHRLPVTVGLSNARMVQIVGGLAAGDRIVLGVHQDLRDGMRVRVRDVDGTEAAP